MPPRAREDGSGVMVMSLNPVAWRSRAKARMEFEPLGSCHWRESVWLPGVSESCSGRLTSCGEPVLPKETLKTWPIGVPSTAYWKLIGLLAPMFIETAEGTLYRPVLAGSTLSESDPRSVKLDRASAGLLAEVEAPEAAGVPSIVL